MSKGALLIARNNSELDYIKQAIFCAERIKKYVEIPVTLITDNRDYLLKTYKDKADVFDEIIEIPNTTNYTYRKYNDGNFTRRNLEFKNNSRSLAYELSPYEETLLLDTDYIVGNDVFKQCFEQPHDFLIYKDAFELSGYRDTKEFEYISETGPEFYWATCVFFRKTSENKMFFDLIKHLQDNWFYYQNIYDIQGKSFRNDFAFSIAIHIMNGYKSNNEFAKNMPGTMFYTTDKDVLLKLQDESFKFLVEYKDGSYFPASITGSNVHVMNKYSLNRIIDNA